MPYWWGPNGTSATSQPIADLTASVGTADGVVADVGAAFTQATLNDNFREMSTKINLILAALRADGTIGT